MRKTLGTCLLVLLLTGPAIAGEMPNDAPAPPPPPPASPVQQSTTAATTEDGTQGTFQGGVAQVALDLLALLPSLL